MTPRIVSLDEVASTNIEVKRAIEAGEPEGLVVRARRQSGGYGRQGRPWKSPEGGLYFSMLLRPEVPMRELPTLALLAGMAVRRALVSLVDAQTAERIKLKWPNDIVVSAARSAEGASPACAFADGDAAGNACVEGSAFAKLCGISSEARKGAVCVGVGVNVHPPAGGAQALPGSKNAPVYLADLLRGTGAASDCAPLHPPAELDLRDQAFSRILEEFSLLYGQWCARGFAPFASEYAHHDALSGRRIDVVDRMGEPLASGIASGVDADGCLLVASDSGIPTPVASGEAHIL